MSKQNYPLSCRQDRSSRGAVRSYVEPALPSGAAPVSAPASAPVTAPVVQAAPKSLAVPVADSKTLSVPVSSMLGAQR